MAQLPSFNDTEQNLWAKIASNLYGYAVGLGIGGLTPPSWNDNIFDLQKKATYYTARLADAS